MSISGICAYLIRALAFAAAMGAIYCLALRICKKRVRKMGLLCIMYLSAVTEIIALRFGMPPVERELQLVPLQTTLSALQAGAWPFIYHVGGNLAWFVPLGVFIQLPRSQSAPRAGTGRAAVRRAGGAPIRAVHRHDGYRRRSSQCIGCAAGRVCGANSAPTGAFAF